MPAFLPRAGVDEASLIELVGLTQEEFSRRFKDWMVLDHAHEHASTARGIRLHVVRRLAR